MIEEVTKTYWRCARAHLHPSLANAEFCEAQRLKTIKRLATKKKAKKRTTGRSEKAYNLYLSGKTWVEVGQLVGYYARPETPLPPGSARALGYGYLHKLFRKARHPSRKAFWPYESPDRTNPDWTWEMTDRLLKDAWACETTQMNSRIRTSLNHGGSFL